MYTIHSVTYIYIYVQYSTDNHYVTGSSFPLPLYRQSLHGRNFALFVTVLTIIIWQGVCFHYHCADNHYMAGTFFLFITVLKSLYSREFVSITAVPTIIPWRNFVLFITAPTIIIWHVVCFHYRCADNHSMEELCSIYHSTDNHYMAWSLFPLPLCRQSLYGMEFVSITAVPTIIIWHGVCFHYRCADNHSMEELCSIYHSTDNQQGAGFR